MAHRATHGVEPARTMTTAALLTWRIREGRVVSKRWSTYNRLERDTKTTDTGRTR
jgi:hypothetical protein